MYFVHAEPALVCTNYVARSTYAYVPSRIIEALRCTRLSYKVTEIGLAERRWSGEFAILSCK